MIELLLLLVTFHEVLVNKVYRNLRIGLPANATSCACHKKGSFFCIAKRVTGHGVNSNFEFIVTKSNEKSGIGGAGKRRIVL